MEAFPINIVGEVRESPLLYKTGHRDHPAVACIIFSSSNLYLFCSCLFFYWTFMLIL